ncbi:MAG: hypothetical protein C4326_01005 [Ignavibacteria bacterium]
MSRRLILSWCVVLSIVVAGTSLAQDPAMWNAAKRMKFGLDAPTPAQPSTSGGAATMNPMSPPNTPDVAVFAPSANAQSENSIGVNFSNPQQLMVSTNGRIPGANPVVHQTWAFSTNGGLTWPANMQSEDLPPNVLDSFGDPVAFFDVTGRAYFCTLGSPGGIYFVSTTNFGATWSARSNADNLNSTNDDKQHAAADYSGTYPNNVYAAWTDFGVTGSPVVFARSTNQGQTWLPRVQLQIGSNRGQGVHIATGPNGEVYLMWAHYTSGTAEVGIGFAKSTDGGATFSTPTVAYTISGIRISNGGIPALNNVRAASFPYHDVDRSNGPRRGWIYAVTPELVSGQADIFLRRSTDGGATWSAPIQVNGPDVQAGKWQFMASLAVDPTNGGISVSYYSMDSVGTNFMTNRYMAYSNDGGNTWDRWVISDVRANWQPQGTPNTNATYNGDYYETAATNGKAWAIWTDRRTGTNKAYVEVVTYSENFGWVRGLVTRLGTGTAVPGVAIDFVDNIQQQGSTTDSTGFYLAGARVDTPGNTRNVTLRARKFGYIDTTIAITLTRFDTLTRNFQIRQAPSGTLSVYSHTATTNLRSFVEVKFGTLTVFADSTNGTTGRVSTTLPAGTYSVRVDAPPPYRTLNFPSVVINAAQTTNVDALTSPVLTFNPTAMRDTLPVGGSRAKNLTITNTSPDSVQFRIWDDNALRANRSRVVVPMPPVQEPPIEKPKGAPDTEFGDSPNGRGGPDAFGYSWIDSDEPGGPTFSWLDIKSVGTQITTWTGSGDDGYARVTLPFSFSFYGSPYTDAYVGTNGFLSFGAGYTSWFNTAIPTTAPPNNAIYPFWDDLNFNEPGGTAWYYYDAANQRFIVQWDSVSHYGPATTPGRYTFQTILYRDGRILTQYRRMEGTLNSATIGIENSAGTIGLQVVFNAAYMHDNLAILFSTDILPWVSTDRTQGTIAPGDSQAVQLRVVPNQSPGTYTGRLRIIGANTPSVGIVGVRLTITGGLPSITVTSPNGGEVWRQGNTYPITWTHVSVDTVRIEYSTTGSTGPWNLITAGVPARPVTKWIHPKALARGIDGGVIDEPTGTYNWTIPTTVPNSNNCYVKISQKSNQTVFDISNAAFTITSATGDTGWVVQPSGTTATLYTVKAVSNLVAWAAGTGGVVLRTTNGGANWTNVTGAPIGTADIYTLEALDANTAFVSTSPSGTNIYRTTNGGASWALVFNEPNAAAFIDGIRMQNATTGFAMGDPLGGTWMVLRTTNGGASWARITTEPPQVGSEAGWNNSYVLIGNTMWFGTNSSKVYRSTDAGATWGYAPTTSENSFGLHFNDLNSGMAGFAGGVTNRSTNGGTSWAAVASAGTGQVSGVGGVSGAEFWAVAATSVYYTSNGGTSWTNAAPNGYPGTQALWAISMTSASNNTYGWAVGAVGTIVRYRRTTTGVENPEGIPTVYALNQNFPNPFNPSTTIRFALPEEATVSLKVYNVLGQEVATLAEGQLPAAFHNVVWNGTNNSGVPVATGMYFYRLEATGASGQKFTSLKKLILLK